LTKYRQPQLDLNNDPEEMNNLADHPEFESKIDELKNAIQHWMME
jgi:hypothetical protein